MDRIIGTSPAVKALKATIRQVASSGSNVLIDGESGTGKELVADALHTLSERSARPYVKLNTAAIPRDLLESELFGHERGSFTGAVQQKKGKFEVADTGTIFLDEIGEMSMDAQVKLLRVLQDGTFNRVGGNQELSTNVRLVCATNRNLKQEVLDGSFRMDLYYRLNVVNIHVPSLRERRETFPFSPSTLSTASTSDKMITKCSAMMPWPPSDAWTGRATSASWKTPLKSFTP